MIVEPPIAKSGAPDEEGQSVRIQIWRGREGFWFRVRQEGGKEEVEVGKADGRNESCTLRFQLFLAGATKQVGC